MTATERLRQLLDERGVEWWEDAFSSKHRTVFDGNDGVRYCVYQLGSLLFISSILSVTPEQAVEATLRRGTCKDIGGAVFECSECGCKLDLDNADFEPTMWVDGVATVPLFCPNCGRRVECEQ